MVGPHVQNQPRDLHPKETIKVGVMDPKLVLILIMPKIMPSLRLIELQKKLKKPKGKPNNSKSRGKPNCKLKLIDGRLRQRNTKPIWMPLGLLLRLPRKRLNY